MSTMCKSKKILMDFLEDLKMAFEIKINESRYFVGFKIERNRKAKILKIHYTEYIRKVIASK